MAGSGSTHAEGGSREKLAHILDHLRHQLPAQAPLPWFVHHNTLHGLQHLPFEEAVALAEARSGRHGYLPEARFRALHAEGRITDEDLRAALRERVGAALDEPLLHAPGRIIRRGEVLLLSLVHHPGPTNPEALPWKLEEEGALVGHEVLWRSCLEALGLHAVALHPETLMEMPEDLVEALLVRFRAEGGEDGVSARALHERMAADTQARIERLFERVGVDFTARDVLRALTGEDLLETVGPSFLRLLAAQLDEGLAPWRPPDRARGLAGAWRALVSGDLGLDLLETPSWRAARRELPEDPLDALAGGLTQLGVPEARWEGYLGRLAQDTPGWMGMICWREQRPGHPASTVAPVGLADALAIRLFLDRLHLRRVAHETWRVDGDIPSLYAWMRNHPAEAKVRLALYAGELPDHLAHRARTLVEDPGRRPADRSAWRGLADMVWTWRQSPLSPEARGPSVTADAWPLYMLCRRLGLSSLEGTSREEVRALLEASRCQSANERGATWLSAYERPYRDRLLAMLPQGRLPAPPDRPAAQLVFCIDDREEGFRRHLESTLPGVETFGAAGFFGVAMRWRGLGAREAEPLCPINRSADLLVEERPRDGAEPLALRQDQRRSWLSWLGGLVQEARRGPLLGHLLSDLLAPLAGLALAGEALSPGGWGALRERASARALEPPPTRAALEPRGEAGIPEEQREALVAGLLRGVGLTGALSRLVVLVGHGSFSQNNPYLPAYDCGACGGRHGGPNARVYAALANLPEVRARLAAQGLPIPADTWFLGAEHDTASETLTFYDLEDLPADHAPDLERLRAGLEVAAGLSARERCRRFASAPADPSPAQALAHVRLRARDPGESRPELGHATVAAAVVGRRALTRGLSLDRRVFLVSYDPEPDADGRILEQILLGVVPVGAGISLEYYFSASNDTGYGAGTKAGHNVVGLLGVLDGGGGDLRTGLPRQMVEIHEPMRLLMVIEAPRAVLEEIAGRNQEIGQLVGGGWVQLVAREPADGALWRLRPERGWVSWPEEGAHA